ncbi:MAG: hypothetical protein BGO12_04405 [Verrucomicrobia bacterium 61-8]|nr:MAG: hypothetical protein BGO12_04405 [Verrucomicrobia bacterium 61-8]
MKTALINRRHTRALALSVAGKRAHKFTRVGEEFLVRCDAHLREFICRYVHRLPSKGKTIT